MSGLYLIPACALALVAGFALGRAANARWGALMPRWLPSAVLVPGLIPIAWHFRRISDFIAPVPSLAGGSDAARELETLSLALPFTVVAVWGLAVLLARRFPAIVVAFPIAATALYLSGMAQAAPHVREVVDARHAWLSLLIAAQIPMTALVAGFLRSVLGRGGLFLRWPLRTR
jgi:hypothetical protein